MDKKTNNNLYRIPETAIALPALNFDGEKGYTKSYPILQFDLNDMPSKFDTIISEFVFNTEGRYITVYEANMLQELTKIPFVIVDLEVLLKEIRLKLHKNTLEEIQDTISKIMLKGFTTHLKYLIKGLNEALKNNEKYNSGEDNKNKLKESVRIIESNFLQSLYVFMYYNELEFSFNPNFILNHNMKEGNTMTSLWCYAELEELIYIDRLSLTKRVENIYYSVYLSSSNIKKIKLDKLTKESNLPKKQKTKTKKTSKIVYVNK